jgi:hypothetical protein
MHLFMTVPILPSPYSHTPYIQENNVSFFKKLGWKPVGPLENYVNRPHQLMEADLAQVPEDF